MIIKLVLLDSKRQIILHVDKTETIEIIKMKYEQETGICVSNQRLLFCGKSLADTKTLEEYNISEEQIIHVVLASRGD